MSVTTSETITPDTAKTMLGNGGLPTPSPSHSSESILSVEDEPVVLEAQTTQKKKKKKKSKKPKATKEPAQPKRDEVEGDKPPVLCISRNKHWRYISSYHGPWLQLPVELLESLLVLNMDPATLTGTDTRNETRFSSVPPSPSGTSHPRRRDRGFAGLGDYSPPDSPQENYVSLPPPPPFPTPKPGKAVPPPIDPGVFRSVASIRRLIDEASELSVRASSGLSAAALGSMRDSIGRIGTSPWATAQALGLNPMGDSGGGGSRRNVAMSAMRVHRLRALAVQKLAAAYKADEIASSVMVMQGGSVFDDIAERVLKVDPNDVDARYVHFFHEKIPSRYTRQLAESTTTQVLDELIAAQPHRLEFFRTRGIVRCFRDEYAAATKDFTYALKEARAQRKAKFAHHNGITQPEPRGKSKKKKNGRFGLAKTSTTDGRSSPNEIVGNEVAIDGPDGEPLLLHPSVLPDAPDPIEPQCLFLRGAAYMQHAVFLIEETILKLEGIRKEATPDGAELRLCYLENGGYGGIEIGNPDGPLGKSTGAKARAYSRMLNEEGFKEQIVTLLKKSVRDHEKFLSHFDTLETPESMFEGDLAQRTEYAFRLTESLRPGNRENPPPLPETPAMFTTYHPLLVESHFSILVCQLMLGDLQTLLATFSRTAALVDGLEGYPVFLPPRSMAQAEFIEVLERLASGWRIGIQPHSLSKRNAKLRIEAPPSPPLSPSDLPPARTTTNPTSGASSSSSSSATLGSRSSSSVTITGIPNGTSTSASDHSQARADRVALADVLDCLRILLAPVVARQRDRAEKAAAERAANSGKNKKPASINIPMHGPRVEIVLAWLAATYLGELECVA